MPSPSLEIPLDQIRSEFAQFSQADFPSPTEAFSKNLPVGKASLLYRRRAVAAQVEQKIDLDGRDLDSEQAYFDAYCDEHRTKFSQEFEPNKSNPVW